MANNEELLVVLEHIEREKGIDKEILFKAIETALVSAARKIIGDKEADVAVTVDRKTGEIKMTSAGKEIKSEGFGRIAAQAAKQVIIQRIREAERDIISADYTKRVGTLVNGSVHRFEKGDIIVDLGKTEGIIPRSQQSQGERYRQGERIRAYVIDVNKTGHGPLVLLSRSDPAFVKKLFEIEVPEIQDGVLEIKAIAREAGERTKIAVWSKDDKVDAVGACVGMRGNRVKDIVRELHGERVDIIKWSDDIREYATAAISPAEPCEIKIDKEKKKIEVVVPNDQLSIGIGKRGQNIRLASKLVGWDMDIRGKELKPKEPAKAEEAAGAAKEAEAVETETTDISLTSLKGVGEKVAKILTKAGYDTVDKIKGLTVEDLTKLDGIGEKTAAKILESAKELHA